MNRFELVRTCIQDVHQLTERSKKIQLMCSSYTLKHSEIHVY